MGLVDLTVSCTPDRTGRQWTTALTEAGQDFLNDGNAEPPQP